jgi:hypothetical protein
MQVSVGECRDFEGRKSKSDQWLLLEFGVSQFIIPPFIFHLERDRHIKE